MSTEQNKKVAVELFARFTASDIAGVMATMTDDATWLIPGKPDASPAARLYPPVQIAMITSIGTYLLYRTIQRIC